MEMVAATKMRRAQLQALSSRPYSQELLQVLVNFLDKGGELNHPLLTDNNSDITASILLTTDKSLCGALNTNLFRLVMRESTTNSTFYTFGRKGTDFVVKTSRALSASFPSSELITFNLARQIRQALVADFLAGKIGYAQIIFPNFISTLRQEPKIASLLPINLHKLHDFLADNLNSQSEASSDRFAAGEYKIEPDITQILDYILIHYLDITIYQALLELRASEHSARMMAMQNSTTNAKELVSDLTLSYNQIRQEAITTELLEITSASAALE